MAEPHRKRVRHYNYPSHCHELTFSCYGRRPLLTNDSWRELLSRSIDSATDRQGFGLIAFVFMREHVHLLVFPSHPSAKISSLLKGIKQPVARRVKLLLVQSRSSLLESLTIQERPGKQVFRFWQEGGGYDRNLYRAKSVATAIDSFIATRFDVSSSSTSPIGSGPVPAHFRKTTASRSQWRPIQTCRS